MNSVLFSTSVVVLLVGLLYSFGGGETEALFRVVPSPGEPGRCQFEPTLDLGELLGSECSGRGATAKLLRKVNACTWVGSDRYSVLIHRADCKDAAALASIVEARLAAADSERLVARR